MLFNINILLEERNDLMESKVNLASGASSFHISLQSLIT